MITAEIIDPLRPRSAMAGRHACRRARWRAFPGASCPTCAGARSACARPHRRGWPPGGADRPRGAAAAAPPLLVAGPDLAHADTEVTEIARSYPGCRPLLGETATVGATLHALDGAPLAHLAAHGHHEQRELPVLPARPGRRPADGLRHPATRAAPRHVVLSCCDVGRTVLRPGRGDPRLHRRAALHRDGLGDLQRHPGGRRRAVD